MTQASAEDLRHLAAAVRDAAAVTARPTPQDDAQAPTDDRLWTVLTEQIGTSVEDVQDKAKEKIGDVEAAIRRNPSQAALIAAGIGFVFGLILSR